MNKIISNNLKFVIIGKKDFYFKTIINHLKKNQIKFTYKYIDKFFNKTALLKFLKKKNYEYLISYRNPLILNNKILNVAKRLNINFHPSPPRYRGVGGYNLAILNSDKEFGLTAHLISNKIDDGLIIDLVTFKILKDIKLDELILKSRKLQYYQIIKLLNYLASQSLNLNLIKNRNLKNNYRWSKKIFYLKDLEKLYKIDIKKVKKTNLRKIIRSTLTEKFRPEIFIGKYRFVLKDD
jgi:methionyl-tRNA formyltransferase